MINFLYDSRSGGVRNTFLSTSLQTSSAYRSAADSIISLISLFIGLMFRMFGGEGKVAWAGFDGSTPLGQNHFLQSS